MSKKIITSTEFNTSMLFAERRIMIDLHTNPHAFIVNAHHCFQTKSHAYILLDVVLGGDLRYRLKKNGPIPEEHAKFYCAQTVEALGFLHKKKILHRDIKVENIILNEDGYIKLIDFGISCYVIKDDNKYCKEDGVCEMTSGTPTCLAPEIFAQGHKHSYSADFFSLGLVLYKLITGKDLFPTKARDPNTVESCISKLQASTILPTRSRG